MTELWIPAEEARQRMGLSTTQIKRRRYSGELQHKKFGRKVFYRDADVREWVRKYKSKRVQKASYGKPFAPWADRAAIRAVYAEARRLRRETGQPWQVDHIVPLRGETVCGLHVETNLQIVLEDSNRKKGNRLWPDMP